MKSCRLHLVLPSKVLVFITLLVLTSLELFCQASVKEDIINYYPALPDSLSRKIKELHLQAAEQSSKGDVAGAIRSIQLGLLLAERLPLPTAEGFDLCLFAGNIIGIIDTRYGLEFYKKACGMVPHLDAKSNPGIFSLYATRAGSHFELNEIDTAQIYHRKAISVADRDTPIAKASARNNLGVFYFETQQYDSAYFYFQKALELLGDRRNHMGLYCSIQDNIAQLEILQGDHRNALVTFKYNDKMYDSLENHQKYLTNKIKLLETMEHLKLPGIDEQINEVTRFTNQHRLQLQAKDVLRFFRFAADYYSNNNTQKDEIRMQNKYMQLSDSLSKTAADQLHLVTRSILDLQQASLLSEIELNKLAAEQSRLKLVSARRTLMISIFSGIIILGLIWMYFRARRLKMSAQKQIAETELSRQQMEARLMEQELVLKERDLTNVVLHNTQVYDTNQKMIERLQQIFRQKTEIEPEVRKLLVELQSQNQISDRSIGILSKIEDVNEAFYERLHAKFPGLTKSETELCGYLRINLSTKDISLLKNVEATSVKMSRNRLRKKLGIGPEEDLYAFISQV